MSFKYAAPTIKLSFSDIIFTDEMTQMYS
jgi:hypothetical protein